MAGLSDAYENHILDMILGAGFTPPDPVYICLFTAVPTDSTFGTEAAGTGYARVAVDNDDVQWPDAALGVKANGEDITFPTATGDWGEVFGWGILDHATNSNPENIIFSGVLTSSIEVLTGMTPNFPAGSLTLEAD